MTSLYEQQYRRVAELAAIPDGSHSIFETGGTTLMIARKGDHASAFDLTKGTPGAPAQRELPCEVREGCVWVCVDLCT
jgi:hypothetical protein